MSLDFIWNGLRAESAPPQNINDPEVLQRFQEHISHHNFKADEDMPNDSANSQTVERNVQADDTWELCDKEIKQKWIKIPSNPTTLACTQQAHALQNVTLQTGATVWVVGYVTTSKYGLSFLFNTGSVGVYFNDSSKIILSTEGTVFQYIERRRRDAVSASDHVIQTHLITCYPMELQKKVTLLKHFKNYLLEQQKHMSKARDGEFGPDGESSAKYRNHTVSGASAEEEMPFLKKWVKTKHAILFRMSNRTVQVIFYDRSEILLSSEARVITYVSKQGVRTEQSLNEILECGRLDIAKRLKYTKDIMHRLTKPLKKY